MNKQTWALAACAVLAGCGGGGGGSSPTVGDERVQLTSANYTLAVQETLASSGYLRNAGGIVRAADVSEPGLRSMVYGVRSTLPLLRRARAAMPAHAVGATSTYTEPCTGGGTLRAEFQDVNGNGDIDAGDVIVGELSNCVESGSSMTGRMTMTFKVATGLSSTNGPTRVVVAVTMDSLVVRNGALTSTGSGTMELDLDQRSDNSLTMVMSAPDLNIQADYGSARYARRLTGYSLRLAMAPVGWDYTMRMSHEGSIGSTALDSRNIGVSTPEAIYMPSVLADPTRGQVILTGAGGSRVRATVQAGGKVLIELDADGNGSFETSTVRNWRDLS